MSYECESCRRYRACRGLALPYEFMAYRFFTVIRSGRVDSNWYKAQYLWSAHNTGDRRNRYIPLRRLQGCPPIVVLVREVSSKPHSNDSPARMNEICNI